MREGGAWGRRGGAVCGQVRHYSAVACCACSCPAAPRRFPSTPLSLHPLLSTIVLHLFSRLSNPSSSLVRPARPAHWAPDSDRFDGSGRRHVRKFDSSHPLFQGASAHARGSPMWLAGHSTNGERRAARPAAARVSVAVAVLSHSLLLSVSQGSGVPDRGCRCGRPSLLRLVALRQSPSFCPRLAPTPLLSMLPPPSSRLSCRLRLRRICFRAAAPRRTLVPSSATPLPSIHHPALPLLPPSQRLSGVEARGAGWGGRRSVRVKLFPPLPAPHGELPCGDRLAQPVFALSSAPSTTPCHCLPPGGGRAPVPAECWCECRPAATREAGQTCPCEWPGQMCV